MIYRAACCIHIIHFTSFLALLVLSSAGVPRASFERLEPLQKCHQSL